MLSTDMEIQALKVIDRDEIDRSTSRKFAKKAVSLLLDTLNRKEAKYAAYLMAHYLYFGDIEAFEERMLDSDKRMTESWICEAAMFKELLIEGWSQQTANRIRRQQESADLLLAISVKNSWDEEVTAENKVSQDILYSSLHDWTWKKETKTFELIVHDKAENMHKFVIFDVSDIKTVWKRTKNGYREVGRWVGDNEEGVL